ncbi:MAG: hypothetical protein SGILL_007411 [Bacillariaceae sp.]
MTSVQSSPLLRLHQETPGVFDLILQFNGDPRSFQALGKTCKALNSKFAPANEATWTIILQQMLPKTEHHRSLAVKKSTEIMDLRARKRAGERLNTDPFEHRLVHRMRYWDCAFLEDERLPLSFEKIMVGLTMVKVAEEVENYCDNIFLADFVRHIDGKEKVSSWVRHAFTLGSDPRNEFLKAFGVLLEANVLHIIQGANEIACNRASMSGSFPLLECDDIQTYLSLLGTGLRAQLPPSSIDLAVVRNIILRLARKAKVVRLTKASFESISALVVNMGDQIFEFARNEAHQTRCSPQIHGKTRVQLVESPKTRYSDIVVVVAPYHLECAAKLLRLPITKVYDDTDYTSPEGKASYEADLKQYWKTLTTSEKKDFLADMPMHGDDASDDDSGVLDIDMDLNLEDYDSEQANDENSIMDGDNDSSSCCSLPGVSMEEYYETSAESEEEFSDSDDDESSESDEDDDDDDDDGMDED